MHSAVVVLRILAFTSSWPSLLCWQMTCAHLWGVGGQVPPYIMAHLLTSDPPWDLESHCDVSMIRKAFCWTVMSMVYGKQVTTTTNYWQEWWLPSISQTDRITKGHVCGVSTMALNGKWHQPASSLQLPSVSGVWVEGVAEGYQLLPLLFFSPSPHYHFACTAAAEQLNYRVALSTLLMHGFGHIGAVMCREALRSGDVIHSGC